MLCAPLHGAIEIQPPALEPGSRVEYPRPLPKRSADGAWGPQPSIKDGPASVPSPGHCRRLRDCRSAPWLYETRKSPMKSFGPTSLKFLLSAARTRYDVVLILVLGQNRSFSMRKYRKAICRQLPSTHPICSKLCTAQYHHSPQLSALHPRVIGPCNRRLLLFLIALSLGLRPGPSQPSTAIVQFNPPSPCIQPCTKSL